MADINRITLTGRAGADPAMKYFESGKVKTSVSIAIDEYKGKDKPPAVHWVNLVAWDKKAEYLGEYAKKGSLLIIEGSLRVDHYQNEDGANKTFTYVLVDNAKVIDKVNKEENKNV